MSDHEINFFGHKFSNKGFAPDRKKVEALKSFTRPKDIKQLRSFIGMANLCSRSIRNYSTLTASLREVMRKSTKWDCNDQHEPSFQKVNELRECTVMSFYDPHMHTPLVVDGSPLKIRTRIDTRW